MDDILREFLGEARENLDLLSASVARLERDPHDAGALETAYRAVHTIKGTCGFLGLGRLEEVATAGDLLLGRMYRGPLDVTPGGLAALRTLAARLGQILDGLAAEGIEPAGDDSGVVDELRRAASVGSSP